MSELIRNIIFYRELQEVELERLSAELASDPDSAAAYSRWQALHAAVRHDLEETLGNREIFVLRALSNSGREADLTADELQVVADSAERLDRALAHHAGLNMVARDIQDASEEFDLLWDRWMEGERDGRVQARPRRNDRRSRPGRGNRVFVRTALAASVVLFALVLILLARRDLETVTITTEAAEIRLVEMGDGSTARLMGGSRLSYVPPEKASSLDRRAELTGRAFFYITNADAGFVVKTPTAQVTVLGTLFGVRADDDEAEVVLASGRLSLSPRDVPSRTVLLKPGQMSTVRRASPPSAPVDVRVSEQLSWTELFVFASTPLEDIARQLAAHYQMPITVHSDLSHERVTGTFSWDQPLHEILETVASSLGAAVRPSDGGGYAIVLI